MYSNGVVKGWSGRAKALPNACCLPPRKQEDRDTLIEQSNIHYIYIYIYIFCLPATRPSTMFSLACAT